MIVENGGISEACILLSAPFSETYAIVLLRKFFSQHLSTITPQASRVRALTLQWTASTAICSGIFASTGSKAVFLYLISGTTLALRSIGLYKMSLQTAFMTTEQKDFLMTSLKTLGRPAMGLAVKSRKMRRSCYRISSITLSRKSFKSRAMAVIWTTAI